MPDTTVPREDASLRACQRRLPDALAQRWGERIGELPWGTVRPNPSASLRLHRVLQAHAPDLLPCILGGGAVDEAGQLHLCVVRYACPDGPGSRMHPIDVVVTVDLRSGIWRTSRGEEGADVLSLVRWYWHGEGGAQRADGLGVEGRLLAHLGLTALDVFAGAGWAA